MLEEEKKAIEKINIRLMKTPKSCLNEKYTKDIEFLLNLIENNKKK